MEEQSEADLNNSSPIVNWVQKIALYETKARLYVVGSNNTQTRFRVMKIDRTYPKELVVIDDKVEYSQQEIREILMWVDFGNRPAKSSSSSSGLNRMISAFGLVGFVRFLEGYYLILITKRRRVAQIGHHAIYKIEDTQMVYIPNEVDKSNHDELKYFKMFQNIDLSSNFYFSYSYDLTQTLQFNMSPCNFNQSNFEANELSDECSQKLVNCQVGGVRTQPDYKFVWNEHLLKSVDLHSDWTLFIIHGFVSQTNISVFGRPIYLTLVARRSQKFAGTRFLKRGANCEGDVANEVETEQIVHDSSISSFKDGRYTSFVQMRGSIPSQWSQHISKMVPKPPISIDIVDPFCLAASRHFNQLFNRYGAPIFVLNLVKKREHKPHESVLSDELIETICYLNQFLSPKYQINYIGFDMARVNKLKDDSVLIRLSQIAYVTIRSTGIFQSKPFISKSRDKRCGGYKLSSGRIHQTGTVRVNCVDCLDRTNTAQFALGKVALAFQLYALGAIDKPQLEFETDTVRMLEELYEDHGDTLALQYGGSQLVHRIKTYRKIAPLSSHSRDIMHTLSRYYSNTFSDAEKQNVINLFLGVYQANKSQPIWDFCTDFYLHFSFASGRNSPTNRTKQYTDWLDEEIKKNLPRPLNEIFKGSPESLIFVSKDHRMDERTDGYYEQYKPYEFTVFADSLAFNILHTCKDYMPNFTADYSPFCVRVRPGKRRESLMGSKILPPNPTVSGHVSTSSTSSASEIDSEAEDDDTSDSIFNFNNQDDTEESLSNRSSPVRWTFETRLSNSEQKYGKLLKNVSMKELVVYENYVKTGKLAGEISNSEDIDVKLINTGKAKSNFSDSTFSVQLAQISKRSFDIYSAYVKCDRDGVATPSKKTLDMYKSYVNQIK